MGSKYDFGGYATRNDLRCSDGRIIRHNAFIDNDGQVVALMWNHKHDTIDSVIGHALLENREDGVYAYCSLNDSPGADKARSAIKHGDIDSLSIYANHLKQNGNNVIHGVIREVSLVLAGANPGARIDTVMIHSDAEDGEEAEIFMHSQVDIFNDDLADDMLDDDIMHADSDDEDEKGETVEDVFNTLTEKQKKVVYAIIGQAIQDAKAGKSAKHSDEDEENDDDVIAHAEVELGDDATVEDVFNTLNETQKNVVYALIGQALEEAEIQHSDYEGDYEMKENVFDTDSVMTATLSHADIEEIMDDAKRYGSLKDSVLAHAADYGIDNIGTLFPYEPEDGKLLNDPSFIQRDDSWVPKVVQGAHHSPFSRVKSIFANITEDEARAKGYIKGHLKKEEVFPLLKRATSPTTIYKKQKLDRDDIVDITDFNVVNFIKGEMKIMLNEEIGRAILVGDGRAASDEDKISELNIRPIWTDHELYTITQTVTLPANATEDAKAKAIERAAVKARKNYKGSGNPTFFTTEDVLTDMLLREDTTGRKIYTSVNELATALRVKEIVTVPVMEGLTREVGGKTHTLQGIIVNMNDYNVGADKGGELNMFDDFDIDYNQQKYLIETRISGALVKPYSAIVIETVPAA